MSKGTAYKEVFHYKSKDIKYSGKVGTDKTVEIGSASTSHTVKNDVTSTYKGKTYKATTSFKPIKK